LLFALWSVGSSSPTPVVLWHGMGDTCCNPESIGYIESIIKAQIPDVYIYSVMLGSDENEDQEDGFIGKVNDQVQYVCNQIAANPNLTGGFNAVGFSQGSQFLRAYVERCNSPPVRNLISIGGQHQGVYGLPNCLAINSTLCEYVRELLDLGAYLYLVQDTIVQAQYWHDPTDESGYIKDCIFLPDINNAGPTKNQTYKANMISLQNFVMVKFTEDTMVQPKESEWFGFYSPGQDKKTIPLQDTDLYIQDWLGLKKLNDTNRLHFLSVVGEHLQFTKEWFIQQIVTPYLI